MIDFSKCKTTKDYEQVLLDKRTQPLSATGWANTNSGIQPASLVWKPNPVGGTDANESTAF